MTDRPSSASARPGWRGSPALVDLLGVRSLPPPIVMRCANWMRTVVSKAQVAMVPPPSRIMDGAFGILDHRVLTALCDAGVPEALRGRRTSAELAAELHVDDRRLDRMLRYAAVRGWVSARSDGTFRPNRITNFLRSDHPGQWRTYVDLISGPEITAAIGALSLVDHVDDPFAAVNGASLYGWLREHPDRWATFDAAQAVSGLVHGQAIASAYAWDQVRSVCDIGGGVGTLLATLLDAHPWLTGTVLELPEVAARVVAHDRLDAVSGDAFTAIPGSHDVYLLVNVLQNWDDEAVALLLGRVAEAAPVAVLVVGSRRPLVPQPGMAVANDVLMAALTAGGYVRGADELDSLARRSGLRRVGSAELSTGSVLHELRPVT